MSSLPVACSLSPAALKARREGLLSALLRHADSHEELMDGHRLRFAGTDEMLASVVRTVLAERQCCRFLQFAITVAPDEGPITLDLTGPPGTREFMAAMFEA